MRNLYFLGVCCLVISACARNEPDASTASEASNPTLAADTAPATSQPATAVAELAPTAGHATSGTLQLTARDDGVHISGRLVGLEPGGTHGMHVHEKGDCSAPDAKSAGEHFAPTAQPHGPPGPASHVGDLGNVQADSAGVANVDAAAVLATLGSGAATDLKGKSIVVHKKQDDLQTQPSGDSGDRIACGVIS